MTVQERLKAPKFQWVADLNRSEHLKVLLLPDYCVSNRGMTDCAMTHLLFYDSIL